MKFGKSLTSQIEETLPEWRDKFLSYKEMKKRLKLIDSKSVERMTKRPRNDSEKDEVRESESGFIRLLENELEKFNNFFAEKEEEYIITLKEVQDRVNKEKHNRKEMINIRKEIVDFHGEMVLLENYSALNYTGLVKIVKKYEKKTGALIRLAFIQKVLRQPFFTTDLLYKLVKACEGLMEEVLSLAEVPAVNDGTSAASSAAAAPAESKQPGEIEQVESLYMKRTMSALRVLKEIRNGSSTVNVFSLPPLQINVSEYPWKKTAMPMIEQAAK